MKATQLDSIVRDYEHTEEQEAIMRETISKKNAVRNDMLRVCMCTMCIPTCMVS